MNFDLSIMITLIYGEDVAKSRAYFSDIKKTATNPISFDGEKVSIADITQAVQGEGLFEDTKQIFVEELLSKKKSKKDLEAIIQYLNNNHEHQELYLWESKLLTKKQIQQFNSATSKQFDLPKVIFSFLDNLYPGNGKKLIALFHEILETEDAEFIFFMIVRQIRILLAIKDPGQEQIDEVIRIAPWQKSKLQKQAQAFDQQQLLALFQQLYEVESGMKTGKLAMPLTHIIDFLLINL